MVKCFSFTASRDWWFRLIFINAGFQSTISDLGDGTQMHCWIPRTVKPHKPSLLLIHGFGANAMWQWSNQLRPLLSKFNVFVPDLVFFGDSFTSRLDRSESFQAQCVRKLMNSFGIDRMSVVGVSYGGFVAYSMALQYPQDIENVVLCCAGVCVEESDMGTDLFKVKDLKEATSILLPQTPEKLRQLVTMSFVRPPKVMPSCFLSDFIDVMCTEYTEEKRELIEALIEGRKLSDLAKISQPTLIIWGEKDQIFPLELGYRLKRHLEENSQMVIIKNAGHAFNLEKPKEFCNHLKSFLFNQIIKSRDKGE